ncbi:Murein DD-endopeptidase MepM and murein hydrolase activator NlpD, contain LysM domain [Albimonas donghaensis]|uniref:Murein DD-endopeptidase MepM and murein hydrolase activator NlpD, contain LysM domain n=1 Tax=Albimonas donghaensis TaxID=356660 RepID=A0A1H2SFN4_9RHOB|nr:Murein DD-endopeptidase MepM and murein hydrolase activator NlpD, contain LysM domain [Albimonas donghaensis]
MTSPNGRAEEPRAVGGLPDWRLTIRKGDDARHIRVSTRGGLLAAACVTALLGWTGFATVSLLLNHAEREALAARVAAYESGSADAVAEAEARRVADLAALEADRDARLAALTEDRDAEVAALEAQRDLAAEQASDALARLDVMSRELARRQASLVAAADAESELTLALESLRAKLADAVAARDEAERARMALAARAEALNADHAAADAAEDEWTSAIEGVTAALEDTTRERDAAVMMQAALADRLETLESERGRAAEARARLFSQLEDAVDAGLGGLEKALDAAGVNPDQVVAELRRDYSGEGGPFLPVDESASPLLVSEDAERVANLLGGLERASLMQVAAAKLPLAKPVHAAFRFTSGFGVRRDPKNGRSRMHAGTDFAAARGTPIHTTADGVVTFAGWQSGYGRVIKIRHAFGFETVYAHLNATRVKVGQRVARNDRIGDMGNSGRSTGSHLHYEIRLNGKPLNPMKYIEAARNVL